MASPKGAISIFKCFSPQRLKNASVINQALSPRTPIGNSLSVESIYDNNRRSPIFNVDTPNKNKIINEGYLEKSHKLIGTGAFGTVYEASYKGKQVAAKIIKNNRNTQNLICMEKKASFLNHSNIVKILKVDEGPALTLITMELCGTSLEDILQENVIPKNQRIYIWECMAKALKYCHNLCIVHADVKPKNILMGKNNQPKLADFGSALFTYETCTHLIFHGTPGYAAPEVVLGKLPIPASDIFSLGILAWQMISRKPPFAGLHKHTILYLTGKGIIPSDYNMDDGFKGKYKDLYKKCCNQRCEERPSLVIVIKQLRKLKIEYKEAHN